MNPFLQKIVHDIRLENDDLRELKDHCYVFPTRRAGVYFRQYLTQHFANEHLWSPHIFSIVEFTEFITDKVILEPVTLIFELFRIYRQHETDVNFDRFYAWGQVILKDFDELDKYVVDADKLFTNLKDIKEIEEFFELPEEQLDFLKQFWHVFKEKERTEEEENQVEEEFIKIWQVLGIVYQAFKKELKENDAAYDGMAQREIAEKMEHGKFEMPFKRLVFAGFNALSIAEKKIFEHLTEYYNTTIYWDTDDYYMKVQHQEAGKFVRQYYEKWHENDKHDWTSKTDFRNTNKNIHLVGIPLKVGQAKYTGQLLEDFIAKKELKIEETAVVLGDETLLFPVLYSLPKNVERINITMGYPLKDTPLYDLLEKIIQLQKTRQESEVKDKENPEKKIKKTAFYSKIILQILNNPFVKNFNKEAVLDYMYYIERNNLIYIYGTTICEKLEHKIFQLIFTPVYNPGSLMKCYNDILILLFNDIKERKNAGNEEEKAKDINIKVGEQDGSEETFLNTDIIELEFIYHLLKQLYKIKETLHKYRQEVQIETFWKIFREVIQTIKLPFTGEPMRGLQIMGFLETRTLDFENLFVLGLNEGAIPAKSQSTSFIPFNLRKGFGMPTFLDQDAIYAYHFYHLLQRAKNVYLLYNTEVDKMGSSEKSRFLLQIEEELAYVGKGHIKVHKHIVSAALPTETHESKQIIIAKNEEINAKLQKYLNLPQHEPKKLTPTPISTYISCPVQFYFKYLAELYELEQVDEDMNPRILGNILHRAIELLYLPYKNENITEIILNKLLSNEKHINRQLNKAFKEEKFTHHKDGKNLLLKKVIKRLIIKILENDKQDVPFKLVDLERSDDKYNVFLTLKDGREVLLSGIIDRVDKISLENGEQVYRILDYKTGEVKLAAKTKLKLNANDYFNDYFVQTDMKSGFQAYFYAYLFWRKNKNVPIITGIYALKSINQGIRYLREKQIITNDFFEAFEEKLRDLLSELFDETYPFKQTEKEDNYKYSPYKDLVEF
ncbi:MAG: PD-(D/E)XK nuclease family protein [Chitinophagales bacterium]